MTLLGFDSGRLRRAVFASTNIPAAIAAVVIIVLGLFADHQNRVVKEQELRAEVLAKVNLVRAKLEGNINSNIQLVRGLIATIVTEPDMTQQRFSDLAENLFATEGQLRNIAGAPGLVVSLMYPVAGNMRAIGLDYRTDPQQREAALRARDTGELVLAGPINLKQGGRGFVGRFPVFIDRGTSEERFWGIVSAVVDVDRLYHDSGLFDPSLGIDIALSGVDGQGVKGAQFYGAKEILDERPVMAGVALPAGLWQIAAVPKGGWDAMTHDIWLLRALIVIGGALVVVPIAIAGQLFGQRRKHYGQLRRSERDLRRLSQRLELALDASGIGVWEHNLETNELVWDERVDEIYGKAHDGKVRGFDDWAGMIHPDDLERAKKDFDHTVKKGGRYASEYRLRLPDGRIRYVRTCAVIYREPNEAPRMIGAEWDVTADVLLTKDLERAKLLAETRNAELEEAKAHNEHNSLHDSLTGLPNRRYLDEVLEHYAAACAQNGSRAALLHIDLDRFKQINDTLGHAAGDAMLVHAASVLEANVREQDFVARIGGDEFVVVCTTDADDGHLAELAERITRQMRLPVSYQGHQCRFGVSIGIAVEGGEIVDPRRLLVNADIALYRAKSRGRNRHEFFTDKLQAEIVSTKRIADELLNGLERQEFEAFYQPQFDARTLEIAGVEALVRWHHPTRGLLAPAYFLNTAEELNIVSSIDRLILERALADFREWQARGLNVPRISVNVSARRLQDGELISALRELKIPPGVVSFELVESIFLDDSDDLITWNVNQVKQLGIDVEIDDFGTGYASIVSLQNLAPKRLKIDRQLVKPIVNSNKQRRLVESIVEIGKSLDIEIVAEGVETMQHAAILKDIGCDYLQGYAFAKPLSRTELAAFVAARRVRAAS